MAFIWRAISRPWPAIHKLCQPSITAARSRIEAVNTSCPLPASASDRAPANKARSAAPITPAPMPHAMKVPRWTIPRVAASTMLTISPASNTSRKTMIRLASTESFLHLLLGCGDRTGRRIGMIIVEKFVRSGLQRPHHDADRATWDDDLLDMQVTALELRGR